MPAKLTVPAGTTVNFPMSANSRDVHTATAGPGDPPKKARTYLGTLAASFEGAGLRRPLGVSERAARRPAAELSPALHGNGFWNSGLHGRVGGQPAAADRAR